MVARYPFPKALLNAQEGLERLVAQAQVVQASTKDHNKRAKEANGTYRFGELGVGASQSEAVSYTSHEERRVSRMDPGSWCTVELGKEQESDREGRVLCEVAMNTRRTVRSIILLRKSSAVLAGYLANDSRFHRKVRVESRENSRVDERGRREHKKRHGKEFLVRWQESVSCRAATPRQARQLLAHTGVVRSLVMLRGLAYIAAARMAYACESIRSPSDMTE